MIMREPEQGSTRRQILELLRRQGQMTASELSDALGIGAVGIRQHLGLLERDELVSLTGLRRGLGRPSQLYALTPRAELLFPRRYDRLVLDALAFVEQTGGEAAVDALFVQRRQQFQQQLGPRLANKPLHDQVAELAAVLTEHGYMCEWEVQPDGSFTLTEHNCPIDCVARSYPQACSQELTLYENLLGTRLLRESTIATGANSCRYHIFPPS